MRSVPPGSSNSGQNGQQSQTRETQTRETWGSRAGFILAAVGSAVGLGNMWRFSYMAAENGGAAFVLLYIFMTLVLGLPILLGEFCIGRGARRSPIAAVRYFGGAKWSPLGWTFVIGAFLILSYYGVIAGWTARYALGGLYRGFADNAEGNFETIATGLPAALWHLGFIGLTVLIVAGGVKKGIERVSLVLMPLLFGIVVLLAIYAAFLPGALEGYRYYLLSTDFSAVFSLNVITDAAGQACFSLSLAMGCMLTFASYLDRSHNLPAESLMVAATDFMVAFVAGLVVFPMIFAFGLHSAVGDSTIGALFITLPKAFAEMGPMGRFVGFAFFSALLVGALTSAISLLEVIVASTIDALGWERKKAALVTGAVVMATGLPAAFELRVLDWMDKIAGNLLLIAAALGMSLFVGWGMKDPIGEASKGAPGIRWWPLWRILLRYPAPLVLVGLLIYAVQNMFGS